MRIIHLDTTTLNLGGAAFRAYAAASICGPDAHSYHDDMWRATGVAVVPGAVLACIRHGLTTEDQIVHAVARASRCRRSTVSSMLQALSGADPASSLWFAKAGHYGVHPDVDDRPARLTLVA